MIHRMKSVSSCFSRSFFLMSDIWMFIWSLKKMIAHECFRLKSFQALVCFKSRSSSLQPLAGCSCCFSGWLISFDSLCKTKTVVTNRQQSTDLYWHYVHAHVWLDWSFRNREYLTTLNLVWTGLSCQKTAGFRTLGVSSLFLWRLIRN